MLYSLFCPELMDSQHFSLESKPSELIQFHFWHFFTNSHNHLLVGEFLETIFTDICLTNDVMRCIMC